MQTVAGRARKDELEMDVEMSWTPRISSFRSSAGDSEPWEWRELPNRRNAWQRFPNVSQACGGPSFGDRRQLRSGCTGLINYTASSLTWTPGPT